MNKKNAVVVGINDYPGSGSDLSGCVNDALDWQALLEAEGYSVVRLLDFEAHERAIAAVLHDLVAKTGFGDRAVFTFSGHGTWVPDLDYDETDSRDEALACYDYATGGLLLDDEMDKIFSQARYGASVLVLSDSCHSGTVSRLVGSVPPGVPRFLPPTTFSGISADRAAEIESRVTSTLPRKTTSLISGCDDPEYSYDAWFGDRPNGAFTRAAIDTYQSGSSLISWHKRIRAVLPNDSYPQSPQLTASSRYRLYTRAI